MIHIPSKSLNNGFTIPVLGLGTYGIGGNINRGSAQRKIPKHAGYALAYWLIDKSLNGRKTSELARSTSGQILACLS